MSVNGDNKRSIRLRRWATLSTLSAARAVEDSHPTIVKLRRSPPDTHRLASGRGKK